MTYRNVRARLSGAAWYDTVYNLGNANDLSATNNASSVQAGAFTGATRNLHGHKAEMLEDLVSDRTELGDVLLSGRFGRHTLLYDESAFFGGHGITAARALLEFFRLL